MRIKPPLDHRAEEGYAQWKASTFGECAACGQRDRLVRHHVVTESRVRAAGGNPYDLANSLSLGAGFRCSCHRDHHSACARLPISCLSDDALAFAVDLLGEHQAAEYLRRYYSP